jgi:hypothetical protein
LRTESIGSDIPIFDVHPVTHAPYKPECTEPSGTLKITSLSDQEMALVQSILVE